MPTEQHQFRLSHDGVHWAASFQLAVDFVCADILSDGPVAVKVAVLDDNDNDAHEVGGELCEANRDHLVFSDGRTIDRERVLEISF